MPDNDPISRDLLELFIDYISDNIGTGQSSLGLELEFFERNDFHPDIANRLYNDFGYWVNGFDSPFGIRRPDGNVLKDGRDAEFVKKVAIELRNYFREKFGKPPLTEEELSQFAMERKPLPHLANRPRGVPGVAQGVYQASESEQQAAILFAREHYPEAIQYARGIRRLVPEQGYSHEDVFGRGIGRTYAMDALLAVLPPLGNYSEVRGIDEVEVALSA